MAKNRSHGRAGDAPPLPEALPVPVVDNHTHLDLVLDAVPGTPEEALAKAASVGIDRVVQVGVDVASSRWSAALADAHPSVLAAVAVHPNEAALLTGEQFDEALDEIDELAARPRVRAIGETGMDFFRTHGSDELAQQERSFRRHIDIAKRHDLALMIHDRDAHDDVFRVLAEEGAPRTVVFHCYSGDASMAHKCAEHGYYMSFAGNSTFAKAQNLRDAAIAAPVELLLVETDAPFLTPSPYRGRPNASYLVPLTVRALAAARGEDLAELCTALSDNSERVYGPW